MNKRMKLSVKQEAIMEVFSAHYHTQIDDWEEVVETFLGDVEFVFRKYGDKRRVVSTADSGLTAAIDLLYQLK